jgi:CheY-like chemotaxis protein
MNRPELLRILIVDDDRDTVDALQMLVKSWGFHHCSAFDSSEAAWQVACSCRPSVMVIDLAMPKMTGLELAARVRKNADLKDVLLVAFSGYADAQHRDLASQAGFDAFLAKPLNPDELLGLLGGVRSACAF